MTPAALRPPEGDVRLLCERLETHYRYASAPRIHLNRAELAADLYAALAHLRRLAAVEAALQRLGSMEAFVVGGLVDAERDAELVARIDYARRALAPAPAVEGE